MHSNIHIVCGIKALGHGVYSVKVYVSEVGFSEDTGNSQIFSKLSFNSFSPAVGSIVGGTDITIPGSGFNDNVDKVTVMLNQVECKVSGVSETVIKCKTGQPAKTIELSNTGTHPSKSVQFVLGHNYVLKF